MAKTIRCPSCGDVVVPGYPDCQTCRRELPVEVVRAAKKQGNRPRRKGLPIPWGLFLVLGLYFGGVYAYVTYEYYLSPDYRAATKLQHAYELLGVDEGRTATLPVLMEALDELLEVLEVRSERRDVWTLADRVARQLDSRGTSVPVEMRRQLDAVAQRWKKIEEEKRKKLLVIGARDIWDVDGLLRTPQLILQSSTAGGVLIFLIWLVKSIQDRKYMAKLAEEQARERSENTRFR